MKILIKDYHWTSRFIGSKNSYEEACVILVGAPMDYTVSYRPGSRYGPNKIRETSYSLETFSPYLDRSLDNISYFDAGDLELPLGNTQESLHVISCAADEIVKDGKKPLFIGGEHLITFPVLKAVAEAYPELTLLHFDAHADLRKEYIGQKHSHATVIRHCAEILPPKNIYQFGIRSGLREEFQWAKHNTHFYPFEVLESFSRIVDELRNRTLYITLDIDVIDPAYACGTGTPEPGGCTPHDIFEVIKMLKDFNVVGMDLVEVSPVYDPSDRTAILAAKIIREALASFLAI